VGDAFGDETAGIKSEGRNLVLIRLIPLWKPAKQHCYNCIKSESEPNLHAETQESWPELQG
jgi:hypothetical protein